MNTNEEMNIDMKTGEILPKYTSYGSYLIDKIPALIGVFRDLYKIYAWRKENIKDDEDGTPSGSVPSDVAQRLGASEGKAL